jgi:hypothetical protein
MIFDSAREIVTNRAIVAELLPDHIPCGELTYVGLIQNRVIMVLHFWRLGSRNMACTEAKDCLGLALKRRVASTADRLLD